MCTYSCLPRLQVHTHYVFATILKPGERPCFCSLVSCNCFFFDSDMCLSRSFLPLTLFRGSILFSLNSPHALFKILLFFSQALPSVIKPLHGWTTICMS